MGASLCEELALAIGDWCHWFSFPLEELLLVVIIIQILLLIINILLLIVYNNYIRRNNNQQHDNNNSIFIQMSPEIKRAKICVGLSHEVQAGSCSRAVIHI